MPDCPDCDFSHSENGIVFTHRVKKHTDSGEGDSFNLYDDEVFPVFVDMAVQEARKRIEARGDKPTVEEVKTELARMGIPVGLDESMETFSEDVEVE